MNFLNLNLLNSSFIDWLALFGNLNLVIFIIRRENNYNFLGYVESLKKVLFRNYTCDLVSTIEQAMYMYYHTALWSNETNMLFLDNNACSNP